MPTTNLATIDLILMAACMVVIIAWGLSHSRRQSLEECCLGGRSMAWPIIGRSMMADVPVRFLAGPGDRPAIQSDKVIHDFCIL